jgi:hypothetical protein
MDWEEHYSFPQIYEDNDLVDPTVADNGDELDVVRTDPENDDYVGLPDPENPIVWANDTDSRGANNRTSLQIYFEKTVIEAFPDNSNSRPKGTFVGTTSGGDPVINSPCDTLSDVPTPGLATYNETPSGGFPSGPFNQDNPARSLNGDTYDAEEGEYNPLLNLKDVKPGDFGEFTFSAHLCGNPGHLWLQMPGGLTERDNGGTEPEKEVDDTTGDPGEGEGELAENIDAALWYDDNCNNRIDGEPEDLVALAIIDTSGSTETELEAVAEAANKFVEELDDAEPEVQAGILAFDDEGDGNDVTLINPIVPVSEYVDSNGGRFNESGGGEILPPFDQAGGNSPIPHALDVGRKYLNDAAQSLADQNVVTDPNKRILLLSDGEATYNGNSRGALNSPSGQTDYDPNSHPGDVNVADLSTPYVANAFNEEADDDSDLDLPDPTLPAPDPNEGVTGGSSIAETALVARDVDGEPFLEGFSSESYEQLSSTKDDELSGTQTPNTFDTSDNISGTDGSDVAGSRIEILGVATYDDSDPSNVQSLARDTMTLLTTNKLYDITTSMGSSLSAPKATANQLVTDLNVRTGENVIERGTLKDIASRLDPNQNGPLKLDGTRYGGDECFAGGATYCFGLSWSVSEDVGNVIQSDSVSFDLGFVTEQCRNNDNPGQTFGFGNS